MVNITSTIMLPKIGCLKYSFIQVLDQIPNDLWYSPVEVQLILLHLGLHLLKFEGVNHSVAVGIS